ncbi:unnamed protein product [Brassica oleracea]
MAWLVAALSMVVIWVASVCKIFFGATSSETHHKIKVLFVIAHPDDESIFFSPTINYLTANAYNIHILCLSTDELHQACAVLRVPLQQLKIVDHPNLQDGFGQIMTFDSYGVSGHCNHRDVHRGVVKFLQTNSERNIKAWQLVSLNTFRKYCGPIDIWPSILSAKRHRSKVIIINE